MSSSSADEVKTAAETALALTRAAGLRLNEEEAETASVAYELLRDRTDRLWFGESRYAEPATTFDPRPRLEPRGGSNPTGTPR